jgi:hypothetical protein
MSTMPHGCSTRRRHRLAAAMVLAAGTLSWLAAAPAVPLRLPLADNSVRFAVIGDFGTGDPPQYETATQMAAWHRGFPFDFVITTGDNLYGKQGPLDFERKFEVPYKPLLDAGVTFFASLGNHDQSQQVHYPPFNMAGRRYYTFTPPRGSVRFFALDSTGESGPAQMAWLERELAAATEDWKIAYFHHPLFSSGRRHGPASAWRAEVEPLFVKHGVQVTFAGHEHFYERLLPQQGIAHFISGGGGQLRKGDLRRSPQTAAGFDADRHFVLVEVAGNELHFQVVSRTGTTVDAGVIARAPVPTAARLP